MPNVERDPVLFREPILEQKDVKAKISFAEPAEWKPKDAVKEAGGDLKDSYKAVKLTIALTDLDNVRTEHADALPKAVIDDQFNAERYPFLSKKTGQVEFLGRQRLFELEEAFGFDPCFVDKDGNGVEPFIARTGRKLAPKIEGVSRVLNPDFVGAYFHEDMTVKPDNWIDKDILIDVGVEKSEQFGDKNTVKRYKKVS